MTIFSTVQEAQARGERVSVNRLVEAEFLSETWRAWEGVGDLQTTDGKTWLGFGDILKIPNLTQVTGGQATSATFALEGVTPAAITRATESETEAKGRPIRVYLQYFDDASQPLGPPLAIASLLMDVVAYRMAGPDLRSLSISAENLFVNRKRVPHGRITDADQQERYPGDLGLEFVADLVDVVVTWPDF